MTLQVSLANDPTSYVADRHDEIDHDNHHQPEKGNGTAFHVFTPEDISLFNLHNSTIHPLWTLSTGGKVVYTTGCQTAQLD